MKTDDRAETTADKNFDQKISKSHKDSKKLA